jgi:hypothetical protein
LRHEIVALSHDWIRDWPTAQRGEHRKMTDSYHVMKYPFILPTEENLYCTFPSELEDDGHVFFHGTLDANRQAILAHGFTPGASQMRISYAIRSNGALEFACKRRPNASQDGCIFAVRFQDPNQSSIEHQSFGIHVYNIQPLIIGYCIIPYSYSYR